MMSIELEFRGIVKRFGSLTANDHIDLAIQSGEVHAIVGENGAGKTTLMKILYGLYQPDEGEIFVRGEKVVFRSPSDSIRAGLGMVHQQFMLFPSLTVAENVIFGSEPVRSGLIDRRAAESRVLALSRQYGLAIDPGARVGNLPVGARQKVEILKTLYRQAHILILDEPTAVLTPQERDGLFEILRNLTGQGKTVIFITHKLNEVMQISDNATVLRNGRVTAHLHTADTDPHEITRFMVGREVMEVQKGPAGSQQVVLQVDGLTACDEHGHAAVDRVSFEVHGGEIVGIAGVAGNGQTELVEAILGLRPVDGGRIVLNGQEISRQPSSERRKEISYVPEDRVSVGCALGASVAENLLMGFQDSPPRARRGVLQPGQVRRFAAGLIRQFDIKVSRPDGPLSDLSGGNMQKVVVARELTHGFPLLVADQPTRGVDIGSIEFIYQQLVQYRQAGKAILLVSADLNEIMTLADRILVMYEGEIAGESAGEQADEHTLGLMMTGAWKAAREAAQGANA